MAIVKNNLGFDSDLEIFQDKDMFNYSVDTIMLGNFVSITSNIKKVLDIGCNNGALSIFVSSRKKSLLIDAIEIQKNATKLCIKNVNHNNLQGRIHVQNIDFNVFYKKHAKEQLKKYDLIMCNPPFFKVGFNKDHKKGQEKLIATTEYKLTIEQIIYGASKIINQKGYLAMVHKVERFVDIVTCMRKNLFEPKRIQFIYPRKNAKPNLVLIEGRFNVGYGQHFLKNIYLHTNDKTKHKYNDETIKLYKPIRKENNE